MKSFHFFRIVWKINALIIFGAGILAMLALFASLFFLIRDVTGPRFRPNIVNIDDKTEKREETWNLSDFSRVRGTTCFVAARVSHQNYSPSYYSKETNAVRNYFFIDATAGARYWLVPNQDSLFLSKREITTNTDDKHLIGFFYLLIKQDSDGNGHLTEADKKTIALSDSSGKGYTEIADDIDRFQGFEELDDDTLIVFFERDNKSFMINVNFRTKTILRHTELAGL